jgi:hypothetical protein
MKLLKILVGYILCFCASGVFAGTIDPSTPDNRYIEYGKDFNYVVSVCGNNQQNMMFCGSAVAIDDNHFLTAAHVVKDCKVCYITVKDKKILAKKVIVHKDYSEETFGIADIALGYVEEKIGLDFYPKLYTLSDEIGKISCISGYGLTGTFHTGAVLSDHKKRAGSNFIDFIDRDLLVCTPSTRSSDRYTSLEFLIASGDSGGGLFIDNKLAGINSCLMCVGKKSPRSTYGEESGHTRVSKFVDWINEHKTKVD